MTIEAGGGADARVHHVENQGVEKIVTLRAGDHLIKATAPAIMRFEIEDEVKFSLNQARLHGFDAGTGKRLG